MRFFYLPKLEMWVNLDKIITANKGIGPQGAKQWNIQTVENDEFETIFINAEEDVAVLIDVLQKHQVGGSTNAQNAAIEYARLTK